MLFFLNDYSEGMHPKILDAIHSTNHEKQIGYGLDTHCATASEIIKKRIKREDVDIHFLVGGTQTNRIAISAFLKPYEAVVATNVSHIATHETGAIESSGHKIIEMPSDDGKITPEQIEQVMLMHTSEHMVKPKLLFISNPTELGTIYSKQELENLKSICDKHKLYFYLDGARLGNALTCLENDVKIDDISKLTDAFYIGGTKNGAMFGEALIVCNKNLKENMRFHMKQNGALLAKGRYLGIQFEVFFKDDLYFEIAKQTNAAGKLLKEGIQELGYKLTVNSATNLIFVNLPITTHQELSKYCHYIVESTNNENIVNARFVTSFATTKEDIEQLLNLLKKFKH